MILVNNQGSDTPYWPLSHAKWNGWTPTDLVFPFFLFITGVSLVYSFSSRLARGQSRGELIKHVVRRAVILILLGIFINGFPNRYNPHTLRFEGVLQRIGVCYLAASIIYFWTKPRGRAAVIFACLVGYWVLMRFVPVPGFGTPTHEIPLLDPDRNLTAWLDRLLFSGHLYEGTRDPEGVLSTIPAIASVLFGVFTGEWLRSARAGGKKVLGMLACGAAVFLLAETWNIWFPINKKLWTSSFVLLTTGLALIVFGLCYWLLDVRKARWIPTKPATIFGMNAIAAYVFSEVFALLLGVWCQRTGCRAISTVFARLGSPEFSSLVFSICFVLVCWALMWVLYRKRIFFKI
jgi:predicted acyltransferase